MRGADAEQERILRTALTELGCQPVAGRVSDRCGAALDGCIVETPRAAPRGQPSGTAEHDRSRPPLSLVSPSLPRRDCFPWPCAPPFLGDCVRKLRTVKTSGVRQAPAAVPPLPTVRPTPRPPSVPLSYTACWTRGRTVCPPSGRRSSHRSSRRCPSGAAGSVRPQPHRSSPAVPPPSHRRPNSAGRPRSQSHRAEGTACETSTCSATLMQLPSSGPGAASNMATSTYLEPCWRGWQGAVNLCCHGRSQDEGVAWSRSVAPVSGDGSRDGAPPGGGGAPDARPAAADARPDLPTHQPT